MVDQLVRKYFDELNVVHDCVEETTFRASYDSFWNRKWGDDDLTSVDLRWLSLLFMVLAFAVLLNSSLEATIEAQRDSEKASVQFFWACRKAIVLAPTFTGESPDLVRAGILAQGMHIDGETWGFPAKVLESRRRLWCKFKHCTEMNMRNIWVDDMTSEEAESATEQALTEPTPTLYYKYQQQLSGILGDIHDECYGLSPVNTSYSAYEKVLKLDSVLTEWASALPSYFQLENPDSSMDHERYFLYWQRMYLHSAYHFARITLHRTYMLLESITDRFQYSRDACISSACADLKLKLEFRYKTMADRLKAGGAMHNLFNSALVLGIIAVRDPMSSRTGAILEDLAAYCEKQRADTWVNEFVLIEVKVIELCISTAKKLRRDNGSAERRTGYAPPQATESNVEMSRTQPGGPRFQNGLVTQGRSAMADDPSAEWDASLAGESWLENWFGPARNFSEPIDYQFWEDLVGTMEARQ
ncbi:hypothetical protein LMH87_005734 [Akanthomyces muscarius]|uniref:Transcription factor domain-containing protein n=1 Tax=Akanthomyces muscarius TaxID=2231603 RepID=A0A9W8QLB3_AKAMU|nr:hypothetical protein LMH87_005734 [Akanthomyces muscarius]KAJ4164043.1 hypothetical protein LMH87_005734 [Akanthomyces muscarius]